MRYLAASLTLALGAALPGAASEQEAGLQWNGCWSLEGARAEAVEESAGERMVCTSLAGFGLDVSTRVDGEEVRRDTLLLDGTGRQVEDGGCSGIEQAFASADGQRLFTTSDLRCEGGTQRAASGISALLSPDVWLDIQVVRVGQERELMVRRFRFDPVASRALWQDTGDVDLAARTARTGAASVVTEEDVIEATGVVDTAAIEAWLIESDASFALDASRLMALANADVAPELIDLMVALSFPDYFVVNEDPEAARGPAAYGYPVSFYGYYSPAFAPFGWGYYPWYSGYPGYGYPGYGNPGRPGVILPGSPRYGGRVVNGKGYARVTTNPDAPSGDFGSFLRNGGKSRGGGGGSQNGGGGGSVSGAGSSSGGGSKAGKTRTAKRRGDG
ncbi:MAG: hypothetical protein GKS06_11305 [Acidobacteria bacterium]|nr:hypothetical protein [Acidobacteriota bacterium]